MDYTIKIAGKAGQGGQTLGIALCKIIKRAGYSIFADKDYMSRVRGGNNVFRIRYGDKPLYSPCSKTDILVALDSESIAIHIKKLPEKSIIVLDKTANSISESDSRFLDVPMKQIAENSGGGSLYVNSVACGAAAGITGADFDVVEKVLEETFQNKGEEIINKNVTAAHKGYSFTRDNYESDLYHIEKSKENNKLMLNGNEAIALGAIYSGCGFYSAYPMTPSTSIMNTIAHFADKYGIVVEQAEDEIAAINMVIGASFAGARAMTGTSGGGFDLMGEGLSLAGMIETPIVVVDSQRPGPATGFPTRTEQSDLNLVIHSGHGEFARVVYSPGTAEEAFTLTVKAFDLADKYQIPVVILTDQHLADSIRNISLPDVKTIPRKRYLVDNPENTEQYKRYSITDSGISPRAVPSHISNVIYSDSDEHSEDGHITEDGETRNRMMEKRFTKRMKILTDEVVDPVSSGLEDVEVILTGFGSTFGAIKEASENIKDIKTGYIHLPQVWPFPEKAFLKLIESSKDAKIINVENNAGGQLGALIRRETGITCHGSILKFDGRPFFADEIINNIKERFSQ